MAENSNIEWTDHTFNPWRGCTKVSPGCAHCYAETLSKRNPKQLGEWGPGKPRVLASDSMWRQPLKWNEQAALDQENWTRAVDARAGDSGLKPTRPRVFCASLADWLDDEVPIEWLVRLLQLIHDTPHLDWLLLTKRPQNWENRITSSLAEAEGINGDWPSRDPKSPLGMMLNDWIAGNPPDNVWMGTTVEDQQRADERIPALLSIPAKVRFLSCEPLLGPVDLEEVALGDICDCCGHPVKVSPFNGYTGCHGDCDGPTMGRIHWVICGGESGPDARPMHPEWALSLRDQCVYHDVPFFFKQWGEWSEVDGATRTPGGNHITIEADSKRGKSLYRPLTDCLVSFDGKTFSRKSLPPGIKARLMRRAHKSISGRLLDGIEHNGFPKLEGRAE